MPSTNQLLPATLGSQVAKQAGKYKQGSPLLDRTAFQTSLQKHQVPICLIQKWECVLGSAIINHLLVAMHRLSFKHTSKREALPWRLIPSKTQLCCFLLTSSIDSIYRLLSKVANHFELLVASTNDTLYWQDPLYSSKRRKCNFLSTRKTRSQVLSRWSNF